MRPLNLVEECASRLSPASPGACRDIRFGGARVFLDPGTLSLWEAEAPGEFPPTSAGLEPEYPARQPASLRALVLSVTHGCNLACRYCYVRKRAGDGGHGGGNVMSRDVARRALELLQPPGPWRVGFFGGEPLLAWDLLREVVELARGRAGRFGTRVRFNLTTNGTLVTPERAEFLADKGFSIILSLDGPPDLHDRERREGGGGSFDRAMAGLGQLKSAGLGGRVTLRATFPLSRPELRARLEYLNDLAERGYARSVSVEPAWPARGEPAPVDGLTSDYVDAARWAASRLGAGKRVRFHHMEKALERVLLRRPAGSECGAGFGYVEVAPSGELCACHKEVGGPIGRVESGISERLRARWRENRHYAREGCSRCWARNLCGGGCRAESIEHARSIAKPWAVACAAKRLQVRAALHVAAAAPRRSLEAMFARRLRRSPGAVNAVRPAT